MDWLKKKEEVKIEPVKSVLKVSTQVLNELKIRNETIQSARILEQIARRELNYYLLEELTKLGLNIQGKDYEVNHETGIIIELEKKEVKVTDAMQKG